MDLIVYLAGEIHSDWRDQIIAGAENEPFGSRPEPGVCKKKLTPLRRSRR